MNQLIAKSRSEIGRVNNPLDDKCSYAQINVKGFYVLAPKPVETGLVMLRKPV
jgi:hypothetical protein